LENLIYQYSRAFRRELLKFSFEKPQFSLFANFPDGCCEFTSYLLAKFFVEELVISDVRMFHGENRFKKAQRHVWLKVMGYDVDITANQFSSTDKTVFCVKNSNWHSSRFKIFDMHQPNVRFDHFHEEYQEQLLADYRSILTKVFP